MYRFYFRHTKWWVDRTHIAEQFEQRSNLGYFGQHYIFKPPPNAYTSQLFSTSGSDNNHPESIKSFWLPSSQFLRIHVRSTTSIAYASILFVVLKYSKNYVNQIHRLVSVDLISLEIFCFRCYIVLNFILACIS